MSSLSGHSVHSSTPHPDRNRPQESHSFNPHSHYATWAISFARIAPPISICDINQPQRCHHWHWYRRAWLKYVKQVALRDVMCCRHGKTDLKGKSRRDATMIFLRRTEEIQRQPRGLAVWLGFIFLRHVAVDIDTLNNVKIKVRAVRPKTLKLTKYFAAARMRCRCLPDRKG